MTSKLRLEVCVIALALLTAAPAALAQAPCEVPDNGSGTVDLPPAGCGYVSPTDFHIILDGLPPGNQINVSATHEKFFQVQTFPGGNLGGEVEQFQSILIMDMQGQGPQLAGFQRTMFMQLDTEVHTGPRNAGDPVQTFPNDMFFVQGAIFGDPDFDVLRIEGGTAFGLPSPGETTLTELPNGNFNVDSFFDVTYRITFQGAPGSILDGSAGTTTDTVRMAAGVPAPSVDPCVVPDNGNGTVDLPPQGCGYVSPTDLHMIIDGLPPGTEINVAATHAKFFQVQTFPGGNLGGEIEQFQSILFMDMQGTGQLAGFQRNLAMQLQSEAHTGPRNPGDPVQTFPNDMFFLQGELFGDPDFDFLRVEGGTAFGLPSPGSTTLTQLPSGDFNVDSFFDVTYRISFQGAPGSILEGFGGTTQDSVVMQAGVEAGGCPPIPAGDDIFPSTAKLVLQLDIAPDPIVVRLSSADLPDTIVQRQTQVGDTIDVEIVAGQMGGFHPQLGGIEVRIGSAFGLAPTLGQLTDVEQDPTTCELISADSFFDVIAEIDVFGLGQVWTTDVPIHLERKITRLPPQDERYENPFVAPIQLINVNDGTTVGTLLYELHHADPPFPPPGPDCFDSFLFLFAQIPPLGFFGPLEAFGPTTIQRGAPQASGFCSATPQSCMRDSDCPLGETCILTSNLIQHEMTDMELQGFDPFLGGFRITTRPDAPSLGQSISQIPGQSTYAADSSFDVFVDITLDDLGFLLRNPDTNPVPVQAGPNGPSVGIRNIPPDPNTPFQSPPGLPIPLQTEDGQPAGEISDIQHIIDTPQDWDFPPGEDDDCFDSWVHLRLTIFNPFCTEEVWLPGHFRVLRTDPSPAGSPSTQEIIDTIMAKLLLEGDTTCAGPVTVRLNPDEASLGSVASLAPAEFFPADSDFDVWPVLDTGIGELKTQVPSEMTTTINSLPPEDGEIYFGPGTIIPIFDETGIQIGEIEELEHEVHEQVICPADCNPTIDWPFPPPLRKIRFNVGIPLGGGGVDYDVVRGTGVPLAPSNSVCLQSQGPPTVTDAAIPPPGGIFFYAARDRFGSFRGTYDSLGLQQVGNRDTSVGSVCPP